MTSAAYEFSYGWLTTFGVGPEMANDLIKYTKLDLDIVPRSWEADMPLFLAFSAFNLVFRLLTEFGLFVFLVKTFTNIQKPTYVMKFATEAYRLMYYTIISYVGYLILQDKEYFFYDTHLVWVGSPSRPPAWDVRLYYLFELGFYIPLLLAHVLYESKKKDYLEMLIHHITTIILVAGSYLYGFERVGAMILFIHDLTDIPIGFTKLAKYLKLDNCALVCFIVMVIMWIYFRLYFFPVYLIYSIWGDCPRISGHDIWSPELFPTHVLGGFLCVLLCLHVFWFGLFMQMAKMALTEVPDDIRSEDSSDGEEVEPKKKK
eukprot:GFYU01002781.1.p1 GENE.GFYU01002781.1~~GFYU01002781.1.p1  ORF type:complete len:317 (+),score=122.26 GFYU01002781.1:165-1115(+)